MPIKGIIFDLDGVLLSTDALHYHAWKAIADREGIPFDWQVNERLRGVSRMESLEILLERATRPYSPAEKTEMAETKNGLYRASLEQLAPADVFPGVLDFLSYLQGKGIKIAIGSSSKNTKAIVERVGLMNLFRGAISDGTNISRSKPDPEVFLKAAEMLHLAPSECLVVEDAAAGIEAAKRGGMLALGVGSAANHPQADYSAPDIATVLQGREGAYAKLFALLEP